MVLLWPFFHNGLSDSKRKRGAFATMVIFIAFALVPSFMYLPLVLVCCAATFRPFGPLIWQKKGLQLRSFMAFAILQRQQRKGIQICPIDVPRKRFYYVNLFLLLNRKLLFYLYPLRSFDREGLGKISEKCFKDLLKSKEDISEEEINEMLEEYYR